MTINFAALKTNFELALDAGLGLEKVIVFFRSFFFLHFLIIFLVLLFEDTDIITAPDK